MTPLHKAARDLAAAGIPVFPCHVGAKTPATAHGFKDATTDLEQIDKWWFSQPYNLALCPHDAGWAVVDVDTKNGGAETWQQLQEQHGQANTYCNATPSGGYHYVFAGSTASSAGKLGPGVDTRGVGGYVLWPPSQVDGRAYRTVQAGDLAPLPEWITQTLAEAVTAREVAPDVPLDLPANIARAMQDIDEDLREHGEPIEGAGSDQRAYELATKLRDKGLGDEKIADLMHTEWAPHFDLEWIETKVASAERYAQNARGVDAVGPIPDEWQAYAAGQPVETPKRSRFYPESPDEQDAHPDAQWLLPGLLPERAIALVFGASGSFKTYLMLDWALSIATGVETIFGAKPISSGAVFYAALEGRYDLKKRRQAWELQHGISNRNYPFYVLPAPYISSDDQCTDFSEQVAQRLAGRECKLIVIDTVFKAMTGLKLTTDEHAGLFVAFCESLVSRFGCAVVAIHHPSKADAGNAYGSGTLIAGFDTVAKVERVPKTLHCSLVIEQHRDAAEPAHPFHFKGRILGPSLVFERAQAQEHGAATQHNDRFSRASVGYAIRQLNAGDIETAVTTHVLALELTPADPGEPEERHRERVAECSRRLGAMASKSLAAYCDRSGKGLVWYLPSLPSAVADNATAND